MTQYLDLPSPSPALLEKISQRFRRWVSFAEASDIAWVKFGEDDRKTDVMRPYVNRQAATGKSGVAAIGVAQESSRCGPPISATPRPQPRSSPSPRLTAGDLLLLLRVG